jgi:cytochrome c6
MRPAALIAGAFFLVAVNLIASCSERPGGKELFATYCASCHPNGGNTVNPAKTLHHKDLQRAGVRNPGDIVHKMRVPGGPGMPAFSREMIPDDDADKIGKYVLDTFK